MALNGHFCFELCKGEKKISLMIQNILTVTVKNAAVHDVPPPIRRAAVLFVAELPIQGLTSSRAVVHGAAHRAPPELVPPRLGPPAARVGAQSEARSRPVLAHAGEPLREKSIGRVSLRRRHVAAEVAEEGATAGAGGRLAVVVVAGEPGAGNDGGRVRDEDEGELAGVGLDEETAALGDVLADAVAVLEAVAELPESVDVAEEGGPRAEGDAGSEVLVALGAAAAVELDDGERVQRRSVRGNRGPGHQGRPAPSVFQASVARLDAAGIGAEFEESVSRLGPHTDEIGGAAGVGAELAENTEDDVIRQDLKIIVPSSTFRRGSHPFPAAGVFSGRISSPISLDTDIHHSRIA
ncbi:K+ efflux antiporter 1 [Striga asiatica]|uniref:K+ efflux antiporter 1 n=1 Tax=Striga asiatica TaxID=4170 RepID=A0A5A7RFT2_STRAF|nr:K+ efflux antiporter 1 [Striga asiatica]